jgi:hypothetical protein
MRTSHRLDRLECSRCGATACASYDRRVDMRLWEVLDATDELVGPCCIRADDVNLVVSSGR